METGTRINLKRLLTGSVLAASALGLLVLAHGQPRQAQQPNKHVMAVSYWDIGGRIQVIGNFGQAIGSYLVLEGKRNGKSKMPTKTGPGDFLVTKVNGKPLSPPAPIWVQGVASYPIGTLCRVDGYETGEMIGVPPDVLQHTGGIAPQAVWHFNVHFVPGRVQRLSH